MSHISFLDPPPSGAVPGGNPTVCVYCAHGGECAMPDIKPVESDDTGVAIWTVVAVAVVAVSLLSVPAWYLIREVMTVAIGAPEGTASSGDGQVPATATVGTMTILVDTVLAADHDGEIVIGADNVRLDCAGHTITGPGRLQALHGINVFQRSGVTVKNCFIMEFNAGFLINQSDGNTFTNNTVSHVRTGFTLFGSDNNTISRNIVSDATDWFGYGLFDGSDENVLSENTATSISGVGFMSWGANRNSFRDNKASNNSGNGFGSNDPNTTANTYTDNIANDNTGRGIEDNTTGGSGDGGTANIYMGNVCEGNAGGGSHPGDLCSPNEP